MANNATCFVRAVQELAQNSQKAVSIDRHNWLGSNSRYRLQTQGLNSVYHVTVYVAWVLITAHYRLMGASYWTKTVGLVSPIQ